MDREYAIEEQKQINKANKLENDNKKEREKKIEQFSKNDNLKGLIFHSDQGWQYQMRNYQNRLSELEIIQSMSRKGNCLDNSIMENFFGLMKKEMFFDHQFEFDNYEQFKKAIDSYIYWYNNKRIKTKLKGLSPVQYRIQSLQQSV